ncbi:outer membrane beta-barrel protein [Brevundimonas sp. 2R-24]|uniref:Outer membrane beta-barrel protein n=1 Tax=Peiella sedimenti TaxID=3061083 RepID=A0ABT8SL55_9CAUL|nr:outer membrane beta-barrel protein [Caulobacteraceae bacterium XZ-24]
MNLKSVLIAAAAILSPVAASAQDWTGYYLGAEATRAQGDSSADVTLGGQWSSESAALRNGVTALWSTELEPDGFGGAIFGGYNHEMSSGMVIGFEASYAFLNAEASRLTPQTVATSTFPALTYSVGNSAEINSAFNLRGRLGYDFEPLMAYVIVGYSWADATFGAEILSNGGYSKIGESSESVGGVTWGLGGAWRLNPNWSVRAEYTRTEYEDGEFATTYRPGSTFTSPAYTETFSQDLSLDTLSIGFTWHY